MWKPRQKSAHSSSKCDGISPPFPRFMEEEQHIKKKSPFPPYFLDPLLTRKKIFTFHFSLPSVLYKGNTQNMVQNSLYLTKLIFALMLLAANVSSFQINQSGPSKWLTLLQRNNSRQKILYFCWKHVVLLKVHKYRWFPWIGYSLRASCFWNWPHGRAGRREA